MISPSVIDAQPDRAKLDVPSLPSVDYPAWVPQRQCYDAFCGLSCMGAKTSMLSGSLCSVEMPARFISDHFEGIWRLHVLPSRRTVINELNICRHS